MTVAGGSAGHTLAMIYAYRDAKESPVPVVFTFDGVGPSCFYVEDWKNFGFDQDTEESRTAAAVLFSVINLWRKTHTLACGMKATFHLIYT